MPTQELQNIGLQRLPSPLEKTQALVLANHNRRNLLGRWLTLLGVNSCRTTLDSTPISSLAPASANEIVITEVPAPELLRRVAALRTRGWRNIIASTDSIRAEHAATALRRDVRVLLRRSNHENPPGQNRIMRADVEGGTQNGNGSTPAVFNSAHRAKNGKMPALQAEAQRAVAHLTKRERTILQLVARGWSNREIGDQLGLSHLTIKSHLSRISRKLGTGDRASLVLIGMRGRVVT